MNESQPLSSSENTIITAEIVADCGYRDDDPAPAATDWFNLSRRLQQQNQQLLQTVLKLEQSLQGAREQLQARDRRLRAAETLDNQRNQDLDLHQRRVNDLTAELGASRQKIGEQETLIAQYSRELRTLRDKMAELERNQSEWTERQRESQERLLNSQQQIRELRTRLQRQQRYTVQYKAALDQCLGKNGDQPPSNVIPMVSVQPWSESATAPTPAGSPLAEIPVESTQIIEPAPKYSPSPKLSDWSAPAPKQPHRSSKKIELPSFLR